MVNLSFFNSSRFIISFFQQRTLFSFYHEMLADWLIFLKDKPQMPLMRPIYYTSHNVKRFYRPRTNVSPEGSAHSPHLSRLIHGMHCSQTHTHISGKSRNRHHTWKRLSNTCLADCIIAEKDKVPRGQTKAKPAYRRAERRRDHLKHRHRVKKKGKLDDVVCEYGHGRRFMFTFRYT